MYAEELPPEVETERLEKMYAHAMRIKDGQAGGSYLYCMEEDKFYHYESGYWRSMFDIEFMGRITENLKGISYLSISRRKQIVENYKQIARKSHSIFNALELINLENGMLSPNDGKIFPHDAKYYSTNRIPYKYDSGATCELWLKTLGEILEGDQSKINILQEFFGYCLTRETKYHKAMLLLGESRSGKSTILQVLRSVVGSGNCSSLPLKFISNPQNTAMLMNKLVNIDTDVSAKAVEFEAEFKTITSGEPVHVNQKFIHPFDFSPYCKLVMAANIFPRITDHSSAFYNRLILIPCDRVFSPEEQNRDLPKQLEEETPGILNWALEGLHRLLMRGKFEELQFMRDAIQELEDENNPVNIFFHDFIKVSMGSCIEKGELYDRYKKWSDLTKNYTLSAARFASCVHRQYAKHTGKNCRIAGGGKRIWQNIVYSEAEVINWQE